MKLDSNNATHVSICPDSRGEPWIMYKGISGAFSEDGLWSPASPDAKELEYDFENSDNWRLKATVDFANARDLKELIQSLDKLVFPIIPVGEKTDFAEPLRIPPALDQIAVSAKEIIRCMNGNVKTRSWIKSVSECMRNCASQKGERPSFVRCIPFVEVIKAKNDLLRVCRLLAWYRGRYINPNPYDDITYLMECQALAPLNFSTDTPLGTYYSTHCFDDSYHDAMMRVSAKALANPSSIDRNDIRDYLDSTISLMYQANNTSRFSADHGRTLKAQLYLGGMWEYLTDAIMRPKGKDSVITCPNCGRFILMDRATKTYCNESCYESYTRNHGKPAKRKYLKWPSETYWEGE